MNILEKIDKSEAPVPNRPSANKAEKFKWSKPCSTGNFQLVMKTDLNIDDAYQRDENHHQVIRIARDFDWSLFGTLSVAQREDRTLWVFDGGHRLRAAFYHSEITYVPCMVYKLKDIHEEALSFVGLNTSSTRVKSYDVHRAGLSANEGVAVGCQKIISSMGYHVTKGTGKGCFASIATLRALYQRNQDMARKVFCACSFIADGDSFTSKFFRSVEALVWHFKDEILSDKHLDILKDSGMTAIIKAIDQQGVLEGAANMYSGARGIMALINSKQRGKKKLVWSPVNEDNE